jgi:hypothetical protein
MFGVDILAVDIVASPPDRFALPVAIACPTLRTDLLTRGG